MQQFKNKIKEWLKKNKLSREWLAINCYVKKRTIDDWLRKDGFIPKAKIELIKSIVEGQKNDTITQTTEEQEVVLKFNDKEWEVIDKFTKKFPERKIDDYCKDKALEFCLGLTEESSQTSKRILTSNEIPNEKSEPAGA